MIDNKKLIWSIRLEGSAYTPAERRVAVQIPTLSVDLTKMPIGYSTNYIILNSHQMIIDTEETVLAPDYGNITFYKMGFTPLYESVNRRIQVNKTCNAAGILPLS